MKSSLRILLLPSLILGATCGPLAVAEEAEAKGDANTVLEVPGVQIGEPFPAVDPALETPAGVEVDLAGHWGTEGLMLVFASNTCAYMVDWLDRFPRLAAQAQTEGVGFVVVNSNARRRQRQESPEAMTALADEQGWTFSYLVDRESALAEGLGAQRTPEVFLFDGDRRLVYRGAIDDHSGPWDRVEAHWALDALRQLAVGEGIDIPSTQALGCAVQPPRRRRAPSESPAGGALPE